MEVVTAQLLNYSNSEDKYITAEKKLTSLSNGTQFYLYTVTGLYNKGTYINSLNGVILSEKEIKNINKI